MTEKDERLLAMLIYLVSFFTAFLGPLIIWLVKKDDSKFIDHHGREYLNFLISVFIYSIIASILMIVFIGVILLPILAIATVIFTIIAAIKAYEGDYYKFPLIFRIL